MAHQCLACGHLFPEGSSAILQGCPQCTGTRFFFTKEALPAAAREAMAAKAQKDLREVVADILKTAPTGEELQKRVQGGLGQLRPSDLRELMNAAAANAPPPTPVLDQLPPDPVLVAKTQARRAEVEAEMAKASLAPEHPDTVNIRKAGQYDIDVAALLERNPIVVHKDGAYHIHLASLFDSTKHH
jgi:predicted  nucleic acid-binding Zn-ribbon protein